MSEQQAILTLADVRGSIAGQPVLESVSFEVGATGVTALLGRNGVGKTSTLRAVLGLIDRTGSVTFDGVVVDITDLRAAARILRGRSVAPHVRLLVVPGSEQVRRDAEAEGIDRIVIEAGGEWRLSGCSMCLGMNGDVTEAGKLVVSTSNRNFVGRQGPGARSVLASPQVAAACAVAGVIADPQWYCAEEGDVVS